MQVGDIVWQMSGREKNGIVTYHAIPHCIEVMDEYKCFFENGCGGSLNNLGKNWFSTRDEAIASFISKWGALQLPLEMGGEQNVIFHEERTDFQNHQIYRFDGVDVSSIYIGGLDDLINATNELKWHKETCEALDLELEYLTLSEIYEQLRDKSQLITVFVDSPLSGEIFQCGNYADGKWVRIGTTMGYA